MSSTRLLHIGSAVVDYVYRIAALPQHGTEVTASDYQVLPGGGFNLMVAAIRAGLPVAFAGQHGTGPNGDILRTAMAQEGVDVLTAANPVMDSGVCTVLVTDDAERTFISWPGAESRPINDEDIEAGEGDWLFASGYTLSYPNSAASVAATIERLAKDRPLVFDPTPVVGEIAPDLLARVLRQCRWLSCNVGEAGFIAGEAQDTARALLEQHCPRAEGVVIRAGAEGCLVSLRNGRERHIAGIAVEAVDTNGAGDTHIGAFIASLAAGYDAFQSARYANAAAAIAVTRHGGSTAPTDAETREFMAVHAQPICNAS
ncbi:MULTISPECIES: PfkB family carbohydrate kinase [Mesorhizobium]|uniref:Ribokinase n=1 Tax=Mesorhizobium denitrificans TaxID=2294114 RepID=A0A371XJJ8_9HYPH|nr:MULTISPECIES: PfkB family carbohydrate kinase [Mesorhizobium]RFC69402.1 ribokinase [Mesorhizobium denitrificans]